MSESRPINPTVHSFALGCIVMLLTLIYTMLVDIYEVIK